jgi:O-antigen/teichoic acid export membrane protein
MLPHLVHVGNESRPRFEKAYYRSVKYMLGLGLPIAAGATALAPRIIELFYGTEFGEAVTPLRILVWDQVLVFWGFAAVAVLLARDCRWVLSAQAGIGAGVNIVAGLLLVPRWGASGAAVATLVSDVVGIVVVTAHLYRTGVRLPWRLSADVVTALAGCAAMIGLLRLAGNVPLLAAIPLGALGYGLALLVLRFLDNDEVLAARRALDTSAPRLEGATE